MRHWKALHGVCALFVFALAGTRTISAFVMMPSTRSTHLNALSSLYMSSYRYDRDWEDDYHHDSLPNDREPAGRWNSPRRRDGRYYNNDYFSRGSSRRWNGVEAYYDDDDDYYYYDDYSHNRRESAWNRRTGTRPLFVDNDFSRTSNRNRRSSSHPWNAVESRYDDDYYYDNPSHNRHEPGSFNRNRRPHLYVDEEQYASRKPRSASRTRTWRNDGHYYDDGDSEYRNDNYRYNDRWGRRSQNQYRDYSGRRWDDDDHYESKKDGSSSGLNEREPNWNRGRNQFTDYPDPRRQLTGSSSSRYNDQYGYNDYSRTSRRLEPGSHMRNHAAERGGSYRSGSSSRRRGEYDNDYYPSERRDSGRHIRTRNAGRDGSYYRSGDWDRRDGDDNYYSGSSARRRY